MAIRGNNMDTIEHWKQVIRQANSAFAHDHFTLAAALYQQATLLLVHAWPQYETSLSTADQQHGQDSATLLVICFSISVQNLAESYARQQRWRRCLSTLNRSLQQVQQLQAALPAAHPASLALLRESCNLRRELCRFSQLAQPATGKNLSFASTLPVSASVH